MQQNQEKEDYKENAIAETRVTTAFSHRW